MSETLSRRAVIGLGLAAGAEVLMACAPEKFPPRDLIYRASDLKIRNNLGYGQGSLILDQGNYHLHTVQHVADLMRKSPSTAVVDFPGLFSARIDPARFTYDPLANDFESSAFYEVSPDFSKKIQSAIEAGDLTYLVRIKPNFSGGETVAMPRPDTKRNTLMKVAGYDRDYNLFVLKGYGAGIICEGRSGAPVLRIAGNTVTNQSYGVVSSINMSDSQPDIYTGNPNALAGCSGIAYFRPNR